LDLWFSNSHLSSQPCTVWFERYPGCPLVREEFRPNRLYVHACLQTYYRSNRDLRLTAESNRSPNNSLYSFRPSAHQLLVTLFGSPFGSIHISTKCVTGKNFSSLVITQLSGSSPTATLRGTIPSTNATVLRSSATRGNKGCRATGVSRRPRHGRPEHNSFNRRSTSTKARSIADNVSKGPSPCWVTHLWADLGVLHIESLELPLQPLGKGRPRVSIWRGGYAFQSGRVFWASERSLVGSLWGFWALEMRLRESGNRTSFRAIFLYALSAVVS
jgi:hypothetical protein